MQKHYRDITLKATQSTNLHEIEMIQSLWSGYGKIIRLGLDNGIKPSVVAKHVKMPNQKNHPRGWNTDFSHLRKVKSYEVETNWYQKWAYLCDDNCKIPLCFAIESENGEVFMVLEDLDDAGYSIRKSSVEWGDIEACLKWLANFHATYLQEIPEGLWDIGTYWHLDTRPDELQVMDDKKLQSAAKAVDKKLNSCKYLSFVHGDAKLANFCFSDTENKVAAVDFQYVGGGCGMKDVAYFIGSCLYEEDCEALEEKVLTYYFKELRLAIDLKKKDIDIDELEKEWREMYPVAWTDFHRFLKGWSPSHWKINSYSEKMAHQVISNLY